MATQETDTTYTTSYATYNAQQAFPKILQADAWHCDGSKYNETLTFDPTHVALSWEDGSETHTATWSWIYLSVKAEQDGKPVEVRMQLTPAETDITLDRDTGTVYLYTSDTENGFYITSDLFPTAAGQPAENELVTWRQPTTDETLQAADDSSTEGKTSLTPLTGTQRTLMLLLMIRFPIPSSNRKQARSILKRTKKSRHILASSLVIPAP